MARAVSVVRSPNHRVATCLLVLALVFHIPFALAGYYTHDDAEAFYQSGYVEQAQAVFRQLADKGDSRAQFRLGEFYRDGEGVQQDSRQACDWFERAANRAHIRAMYELGHCFFNGDGRTQNTNAALYLYERVAEQGLPDAQHRLARIYAAGSGVRRDPQRAYVYLFLALRGDLAQQPDLTSTIVAALDDRQLERAQLQAQRLLERQTRNEK